MLVLMNLLESQTQEIQKRCERVFAEELGATDATQTQTLLIKWECSQQAAGTFVFYLLSFTGLHRKASLFLEEMISHWLLPEANLQIISFKSLIFNLSRFQQPISYIEIVVPIYETKTAKLIQLQLPAFSEEIKKGTSSVEIAHQILETKRFSLSIVTAHEDSQSALNLSFGLSSSDSEEFTQQTLGFSSEANGQGPFARTKSTRGASKLPEAEGEKPKTQVHEELSKSPSFSLFLPRTEDELLRGMISLSGELKQPGDPPQVLISFQQQLPATLKFQLILLRALKAENEPPPLTEFIHKLPSHMRFIPEKRAIMGNLQGKFLKEMNLFTLQLDSRLFMRGNHSIDLLKARQTLCRALEKMVGPFKDHSGTFFHQADNRTVDQIEALSSQSLRLHLPRATHTLDPRVGGYRVSGVVIRMLFEGLCRVNPEGQIEPALAQTITLSPDQKELLITLKESYWSNGSPLTAHDFAYAWKQILDPKIYFPYCFLFFCIKNAEAAKRGEISLSEVGINVKDDLTLAITLAYPTPYFLELLANWIFSPLCRELEQKHPGWAYHSGSTHISNGPFKLELWKMNDELHLVKNPLYWDAHEVKIDFIKISIIDDEEKAIEEYLKGNLDWVGDPLHKIPPKAIQLLKEKNELITDTSYYGLFLLQMNLHKTPFQNANIRKALAYGTSRKKLLETLHSQEDLPAFGFTAKEQPFPRAFVDGDQERAIVLFERGLRELGMSRKELPPLIFSHSDLEEHRVITYALAEQWSSLFGFEVKYKKYLWNGYFESLFQEEHMIGGLVWYRRFDDPLYFYEFFISRPYALTLSQWKDEAYVEWINAAKRATGPGEKVHSLFQAEQLLLDAMPAIPLFYQHFRYVKNPHLDRMILSNCQQIDFRRACFNKEGR